MSGSAEALPAGAGLAGVELLPQGASFGAGVRWTAVVCESDYLALKRGIENLPPGMQ